MCKFNEVPRRAALGVPETRVLNEIMFFEHEPAVVSAAQKRKTRGVTRRNTAEKRILLKEKSTKK